MELSIMCPECSTKINLSKEIRDLIENRSEKLLRERLPSATADAVQKVREEERKKAKQDQAQTHQDNEQLRRQVAHLTKELDKQENEVEERVEQETEQRVEIRMTKLKRSYNERLGEKDLRISELESNHKKAQAKIRELQDKLDEGSPQTQGIIAEDDLYQHLKRTLPQDLCRVEKHGQGRSGGGADIVISVQRNGKQVGAIIVEDKWVAKDWSREWPEKTWNDMQKHQAQFAYLAVNPSAFPKESREKDLRDAGFGIAPCRRSGVRVWVLDRSNPFFISAILLDGIEKLIHLAEISTVNGSNSKAVQQLKAYLVHGYENDLREKAKHLSTVLKALSDVRRKVIAEYDRGYEALKGLWATEARQHRTIMTVFNGQVAQELPKISFLRGRLILAELRWKTGDQGQCIKGRQGSDSPATCGRTLSRRGREFGNIVEETPRPGKGADQRTSWQNRLVPHTDGYLEAS